MNPIVYDRVNWNTTTTPLSADNLNKMDKGIFNNHNDIVLLNEEFISFKELFDSNRKTFTPTLFGRDTRGDITLDRQIGYYYNFGIFKVAYVHLRIESITEPSAGLVCIGGFPSNFPTSMNVMCTIAYKPNAIPLGAPVRTLADGSYKGVLFDGSNASNLGTGNNIMATFIFIG